MCLMVVGLQEFRFKFGAHSIRCGSSDGWGGGGAAPTMAVAAASGGS